MAYNATYDENDFGSIIVDILAKIMVAVGILATVIGLIIAVRLAQGKKVFPK